MTSDGGAALANRLRVENKRAVQPLRGEGRMAGAGRLTRPQCISWANMAPPPSCTAAVTGRRGGGRRSGGLIPRTAQMWEIGEPLYAPLSPPLGLRHPSMCSSVSKFPARMYPRPRGEAGAGPSFLVSPGRANE